MQCKSSITCFCLTKGNGSNSCDDDDDDDDNNDSTYSSSNVVAH